jgi:hypothetical protein
MSVVYARFNINTGDPASKERLTAWLQEQMEQIRTRTVAFDRLVDEDNLPAAALSAEPGVEEKEHV